jgi:hypothetical protein
MLAAAGWYGQLCIYDVRTGEKKGEWAFEEESKGKDPSIVSLSLQSLPPTQFSLQEVKTCMVKCL